MKDRRQESEAIRNHAAAMAGARPHPVHHSNGDELRYRLESGKPSYIANFTKSLPHDVDGFLLDSADYAAWVRAIDSGDPRDFQALRLGPGPFQANGDHQYVDPLDPESSPIHDWVDTYTEAPAVRAWESQGAGLTYDLEGPDAQSVHMPPAPSLDSQELIGEMAEVYWQALCRDIPFADWSTDPTIDTARDSLKRLWWFRRDRTLALDGITDIAGDVAGAPAHLQRRRLAAGAAGDAVSRRHAGRSGRSLSVAVPAHRQHRYRRAQAIDDGMIAYGAIRADQRVRVATPGLDYMQNWHQWLDVQNGADLRGGESYEPGYRFIATPRDLATYVHHDALYEAYLNACLILLGLGAPFDPGLPFQADDYKDKQQGFAQFGGPHILTLVTEVATRALKAVRYQKFNVHRRLRPEGLGGWMYQRRNASAQVRAAWRRCRTWRTPSQAAPG